ncbi:DUF2281 domain-containing protein [Lyngbya sp. CCY1209]|jgi:hypothetical protein|uniref:type II toxin-antitoxin system VapB family antitoxin n=1 Tax=Lyngbya sp. CCY1209 TaxID=2886103 RepID=UPI002D216580|nr:DUF2281 domain-containing protein [Lyngbya sp. CCY1209]MEB3886968.1 DUF2281 domain-containing protein [Lyngbya sp. CCY1209]
MTVDAAIEQTLSQMPEELKREVLNYATYLLSKYGDRKTSENSTGKKRRSGILQGMFVLPLPDDFDEPLEDFQDYMW